MNKPAITKFLAEKVMGWEYWDFVGDYEGEYPMFIMDKKRAWVYAEPGGGNFYFDPIHNIAHAFMVRDAIRDTEDYELMEKYEDTYRGYNAFDEIWDVSAERLSVSAVLALGTPEQIEECGL